MTSQVPKLTDKQAKFCEEYLIDLNATQAAIRAGYSSDTARQIGSKLLTEVDVQARVSELQAERSRNTRIDAQWLLNRLAQEAEADVNEIYDEFGAVRPISEWPLIFRKGLIAGIEVEELFEEADDPDADFDDPRKVRRARGRVTKFKLDSRVKRLELIGRHIGVQAFREQIGLGSPSGGPIEVTDARSRVADRLAALARPEPVADPAKSDD